MWYIKSVSYTHLDVYKRQDQHGSPLPVPPVIHETEIEKKRYEGALRRRQLSLILAGRMKPDEATELKALFIKD